ncbi:hypothetical protein Nepgr_006754 [Nepenthes gracilis]|uniref:Uncharacterized protein n=1 Tax=Nepenthes gracilis TaxID=150966 RepID=A0AAD3S5Y2_NEPGR|nr:hypothetical protein Nepgr_006754 [Nepenthes gracilis]
MIPSVPVARDLEPKVSKGKPSYPVASMKLTDFVLASNSFPTLQNPEESSPPNCSEGSVVIGTQGRAESILVSSKDVVETKSESLAPSDKGEAPRIESAQAFRRPALEGHCSDQLVTVYAPILPDDDLLVVDPLGQAPSGASNTRPLKVAGATLGSTPLLPGDPSSVPINKARESFLPKSIMKKTKGPKKKNSPYPKVHVVGCSVRLTVLNLLEVPMWKCRGDRAVTNPPSAGPEILWLILHILKKMDAGVLGAVEADVGPVFLKMCLMCWDLLSAGIRLLLELARLTVASAVAARGILQELDWFWEANGSSDGCGIS